MRTKFWVLTLTLFFSLSTFATTFLYDADGTQTQTIDGITVVLAQGSGSNKPAYSSYNGMKLYANNTITIDAEQAFKNVQLVFAKNENKEYVKMSCSDGQIVSDDASTSLEDKKIAVWTGETTHLVFTFGAKGQRVLFQIEIDGEPIELNPVNYVDTTALDPEFVYGEPTTLTVPDMNFFKHEYAFVQQNIRVSCGQGSILNNDTAHYFNCNAGYTLVFEASQPMKGLAIDGYVRKLFTASVNPGSIEYLSPEWGDEENEPVVVVKDIDATTVTISCDKNLRCYQVRIYFDANPKESVYGSEEAVEQIEPTESAPTCDILGRPVRSGYRGLVIQKGKKYLVR